MATPQGAELHLDVSALLRFVLHLDLSSLQRSMLLVDVSTPQGSELHLDVSGQQDPLLLYSGLCCTCKYQDYINLCCSWLCLHYRGL